MQRTSWSTLVLIAVVAGGVGYLLLDALATRGSGLVPVPGTSWAGIVVVAALLLLLGRSVRRLTDGKPTRMDALRAARVAMFAKASSIAGSALTGYFIAQTVLAWTNITAPALRAHAFSAGAAALACVILVVVALVVESWCRIPPDDDGEPA